MSFLKSYVIYLIMNYPKILGVLLAVLFIASYAQAINATAINEDVDALFDIGNNVLSDENSGEALELVQDRGVDFVLTATVMVSIIIGAVVFLVLLSMPARWLLAMTPDMIFGWISGFGLKRR